MAHDDQNFPESSGVSAFGSLALQVVSVLNTRQAGSQGSLVQPYIQSILDQRLTSKSYFNPADTLEELRALRLSDEHIIDGHIPDAARAVGEKWVQNDLGFAEVTIASVRLQSLLTEVAFLNPDTLPIHDCPLDVLIVTCEGEQHTLGCFVVAAQLRRRGAVVETLCGEHADVIRHRVMENGYDAVLFSSSRPQDLETISDIVSYSKTNLVDPPLFALGGIILETNKNTERLAGVDLVCNDVDTVISLCEQRSTPPQQQAAK